MHNTTHNTHMTNETMWSILCIGSQREASMVKTELIEVLATDNSVNQQQKKTRAQLR